MTLTKEQILAAPLAVERVDVSEWGGDVCVRVLSADEALAFHEASEGEGRRTAYARLAALCLCDENGARLFTDEEYAALAARSHKAVQRVVDAAIRINGLKQGEDLKNA